MATKITPTDVIIFDGSNACHRLSNALQPLTNRKGERVEVAFGMLRLFSAVTKLNPAKKAYLIWDGKNSKARRQKKDPNYKAHRGEDMSQEDKDRIQSMYHQVDKLVNEFLVHIPCTYMISSKWEADDIMAMIAHEHASRGEKSTIVTGDKDMLQLVNGPIRVWNPNKETLVDDHNFEEFTGYPDGQAFLYGKCLQGDTSDNIPGIHGVGEKTALKLLQAHNWDITSLFQHETFREGVVSDKIRNFILNPIGNDRLMLNFRLMALNTQRHIEGLSDRNMATIEDIDNTANWDKLRKALAINQMASLLTDFNRWSAPLRSLQ